jgi:PTS system N-acetylgalactosamine-specific IIA component
MTSSATDGAIAVVAGHGDFAAGLVSAIEQITGRGDRLRTLSNRGLGPAEIEAELRAIVDAAPVRVIFTDLPAGSCTIAARRVLRERPALRLVVGANLPAVIDFVLAGDAPAASDDPEHAVAHAVERGRQSLQLVAPPAPPAPQPPQPPQPAPGAEVGGAR